MGQASKQEQEGLQESHGTEGAAVHAFLPEALSMSRYTL